MSKRPQSPSRSHSPSPNSGTLHNKSRKRPRTVGPNGEGSAQRRGKGNEKPRPTVILDSSDEEVPGSRRTISSITSSPISESDTNNPSPLGHKSAEMNPEAKNLAKEYDPGRPDFGSEAELEQTTGSQSGEETREGGNCAIQCLAVAEKDSNLQLEEVRKRINQDTSRERDLLGKLADIRLAMGILEGAGF
jgi:hypothetical protein